MSGQVDSGASRIPDALDTVTCLRLGEALFRFLARLNEESDQDDFHWEDAGVSEVSGFIEIERDALQRTQEIIEAMSPSSDSGASS